MSATTTPAAAATACGAGPLMCDDPTAHLLRPGNTNCAGCGMSIGLQWLDQALGGEKPVLVIPACCGIVTAGAFPTSAYGVPTAASTFASAAAVATGIATVQALNGETTPVICWTGDGGTYDIGVATLSAAAERNEDLIYICYDNEIYGNTGGQRSSATPEGVVTSTSPRGKTERKKDMMSIMAAHRIPYAATLSVAHRDDFMRKLRAARATKGFRFLLLLSPCPTGWKSEPEESVELIDFAVRCGLFPLYEVFDGARYRINARPDGTPLAEYLTRQRRYAAAAGDPARLERFVAEQWKYLEAMAKAFPAGDDRV
ncbi:MAG: pyruvate synthase subunit beta [Phycisphaerae bacterium]|nr:thiamine pyrophosphate-dependent enzyme [Phycisphaerae bacterium]NUQ45296.1 pyruvate synthase subunit beta [Phycisphaerae bacterium]